jgi:hypothetical protein
MALLHCICPLMTQSGHGQTLSKCYPSSPCAFVPETAMRRREFISFIGSIAATWPFAARAQQSAMPVIGFVSAASARDYAPLLSAFLKGLDEKRLRRWS